MNPSSIFALVISLAPVDGAAAEGTPSIADAPADSVANAPVRIRIEAGEADAEILQRALRDAIDPEAVVIEVGDPSASPGPSDVVIVARPPAPMLVAVADPEVGLTTREIPIGDALSEVAAAEAAQIAEAVVSARAEAVEPAPATPPPPTPELEPMREPDPPTVVAVSHPPPEPARAEPVFGSGAYLGLSPTVGGFTVLAERRSGFSLGFTMEAGYLFARVRDRPSLRIALGAALRDDHHFFYPGRSDHYDLLANLRIGTEWRRTFAYGLVAAGPSLWSLRQDDVRRTRAQATAIVGAGIVWRLTDRIALGVEADVGASGSRPDDTQLRWSSRVTLMRYFGGRAKNRRHGGRHRG